MEYIKTEKRGEIFIVQINRPERLNALGYQIRTELAEAWSEFRESSDLEVGIFTGTGRAFCAGEDMKESLEKEKTPQAQDDLHTVQEFLDHFHECNKDDCEITDLKEKESKNWFLKGIGIGKQLKV